LTGRNEKREFEEMVARLAGKGRAAGIHLVLATQRPDRTVVTGLIKSNLPMKVCLRVANATNSQIVLGEPGAESLLGKGDLLCDLGRGPVRAQSYFIPQADFVRALGGQSAATK
jgi:DNA segregation ATPase FtsK/SpoIIIE-like protein